MKKMMLATRLRLTVLVCVLLFVALVMGLAQRSAASLMEVKMLTTVEQVKRAEKIADEYLAKAKSGAMPEAEAKAAAAAEIGKLRYSGNEYIWINDMQPRMVMHPIKPELNGKDLGGNKDQAGKFLFVEFVNVVKAAGEGYVDYLWPRPGATEPVPKRSYVKGFAAWSWVLGSGIYTDDVESIAHKDARLALILVLLGGGLAMLAVELVLRSLRQRLASMKTLMQAVAEGDLRAKVEIGQQDEVGQVMTQVAAMQERLTELVLAIRSATESIGHASSEVAVGSQDLSMRTEQAAANLQQTAASLQDLTQQVKLSAEAAVQTHQLAGSAADRARDGAVVMDEVVSTMEGISSASRKISDIIAVIDGVAFQTNILALNAAVEAARAGEQGRGFAVVAAEVRSLAQRSAQAAREIKSLIMDSVERVNAGTAQVNRAGSSMGEILGAVQRVSSTVGEISQASSGQSDGIHQINHALTQLDGMTQQNAALVEQTAAAAESLKQQAQGLNDTVAVFKTRR
ncbi:methyl-accepting chemotaxis protein [Paucibacter oligotrophus]|uniref:Methyl-accepting chemotaxis protein n=1 Tax=Roseateles oligotrophus TaxID=1769250 RepID=A0A840LH52_9BURK|nr:methyl-accepting chemotaxis protein [Roseateles oligotrophus]MBB4845942.1 methyl-accepting chemotaxis protein [Roseateles oligotrophus]